MKALPNPTATTAKDIPKLLWGTIPPSMSCDDVEHQKVSLFTTEMFEIMNKKLAQGSEQEALARVLVCMLEVIQSEDVMVHLDASIDRHPKFTDILVLKEGEGDVPLLVIEVKRHKRHRKSENRHC